MEIKKCSKCKVLKDISCFHKNRCTRDGFRSECKDCVREYCKSDSGVSVRKKALNKWLNSEKGRNWHKNYIASGKSAEACSKWGKSKKGHKYNYNRVISKDKSRANDSVRCAIKKGELIRPNKCSVCGKKCRVQAHHSDYKSKLDIIWVCQSCHRKLDTRRK